MCASDLRCPQYSDIFKKHNVTKRNISSSLVPGHHFCFDDAKINDGKFDSPDRSDETQVRAAQSPLDLNITSFTSCNWGDDPGVMCGKRCKRSADWCLDYSIDKCDTGSGNIEMNDPTLCQDPRVWANVSCISSSYTEEVYRYGLRCSGQNMRCVFPWYTVRNGVQNSLPTQCPDKSDEVFNTSLTCRQHLQQHIDFHTKSFCNENYPKLSWERICTNKSRWLSKQDPSYSDPHQCQSSCSLPGQDCQACSNSSYFPCPKSGQCVHPDLRCDGHPQCTEGEDEDLSMCYEKKVLENEDSSTTGTIKMQKSFL